jgi:formate hydrogenlyase transcriptional activator
MNAATLVRDFVDFPSGSLEPVPVSPVRRNYGRTEPGAVLLGDHLSDDAIHDDIVGRSAPLRSVLAEVEMVAPTDSTVLICGETGAGKELIARAVHNRSGRRANPFVKCNCAAIPTGLLESELFGHEKGAFTSAVASRVGRFELANRGTIFLDEIGETPLELQPKLLRVLQEREFERLGSSRTLHTDARLVAATNVNLADMVEARRFRADLYYRLNVFPIHVPPLRERPEDIPLLVWYFARHYSGSMGRRIKWISSSAMDALVGYAWPGNIRELQNLIERAVIRSTGDRLDVPVSEIDEGVGAPRTGSLPSTLEEAERAHILAALKECRWIQSGPRGAAQRLGINRTTLQFLIKKLGIERAT